MCASGMKTECALFPEMPRDDAQHLSEEEEEEEEEEDMGNGQFLEGKWTRFGSRGAPPPPACLKHQKTHLRDVFNGAKCQQCDFLLSSIFTQDIL